MAVVLDGVVCKVLDTQHVKLARGGAFVRMKVKRLDNGAVQEKTFRSNEKIEQAFLTERVMEYLYRDGNLLYFMDKETFEQEAVPVEEIGEERLKFLVENSDVTFTMYGEQRVDIELPDTVVMEVVQTDPGVKGDTASGGSKPATLVTGAVVQVPLFIQTGEKIIVNTRTGEYVGRGE